MHPKGLARSLHLAVALSALILASTAASRFHLSLTKSFPTADQVLTEAPDTIRLWFNQEPEMALAAIGLEGPDGKVEMGKAETTDDPKSCNPRTIRFRSPQ
jgi:methionine-rich copper-binding protein CopC